MTCDYLAIQGSFAASERAFSSEGITDEVRRNSIEADNFGKLQVLKFAYRTNFLVAEEADTHDAYKVIVIDERLTK